ncbi:hypothetical protein LWI28_018432 [Acer negundo]|uniref:Uncharacterized protein n=1 Tax=Acer negundo TaxID=4023 RepID=A0AAD5NSG4_ACENE|nr:hypothetical protein LWI28_018432 [Acer negundo]
MVEISPPPPLDHRFVSWVSESNLGLVVVQIWVGVWCWCGVCSILWLSWVLGLSWGSDFLHLGIDGGAFLGRSMDGGWWMVLGVLYQVVDDLFEAKTQSEEYKKKKKKGKSYVAFYGVEKAMEVAKDLKPKAKKEPDGFEQYGEKVLPLYSFVDYAAKREFFIGD